MDIGLEIVITIGWHNSSRMDNIGNSDKQDNKNLHNMGRSDNSNANNGPIEDNDGGLSNNPNKLYS